MKLKKILASLTAVACSASMILTGSIMTGSVEEKTIKIMSIGDSITDGYGTDGSYRKFLYNNLTKDGYSIDMVGPNWSWGDATYNDSSTGESFTYDAAHCGYSGYAIRAYSGRSGILETIQSGSYLTNYTPDIVILQIGTNDVIDNHEIDSAGERLEVLADYILQNISSDSALFITTIPDLEPNRSDVYSWFGNYRHSADWRTNYSDAEVEAHVKQQIDNYNSQVKALVESKQAAGVSNIYYGDVNSAVTDVTTQLKDGVHPNDVGYKLMGEYWTGVIKTYLSGETEQPTTEPITEETTEPTTETTPIETTEPVTETQPTETTIATETTTETSYTTTATDPVETTTETTSETVTSTDETTTTSTSETEPTTEETVPSETSPYDGYTKGDIDCDGIVNISDAVIFSQLLTRQRESSLEYDVLFYICDMNDDAKMNVFDLVLLKRLLVLN